MSYMQIILGTKLERVVSFSPISFSGEPVGPVTAKIVWFVMPRKFDSNGAFVTLSYDKLGYVPAFKLIIS
jgi:hypothetical protein